MTRSKFSKIIDHLVAPDWNFADFSSLVLPSLNRVKGIYLVYEQIFLQNQVTEGGSNLNG